MAHFAELDENNVVLRVLVISNNDILDENGQESESVGIAFCKKLFNSKNEWVQTSYNSRIRKRYAGVGYTYDKNLNAFILPRPYASWLLDDGTLDWIAPVEKPALSEDEISDYYYDWDERNLAWVKKPINP